MRFGKFSHQLFRVFGFHQGIHGHAVADVPFARSGLGQYPPVATIERRRLSGSFLNLKSLCVTHVLAKVQGGWQSFFYFVMAERWGATADFQQSRALIKVTDNTPNFYAPCRSAVL